MECGRVDRRERTVVGGLPLRGRIGEVERRGVVVARGRGELAEAHDRRVQRDDRRLEEARPGRQTLQRRVGRARLGGAARFLGARSLAVRIAGSPASARSGLGAVAVGYGAQPVTGASAAVAASVVVVVPVRVATNRTWRARG